MARWGNADFEQLRELQERLQKLQSIDLNKFCEDASKELAARLLALVIPRTPVGDYPKETGKEGGTLRRGWFGHRQTPGRFVPAIGKRLKSGWVNGQYFLTLSEDDLERIAPAVLQKRLDKLLREVFNG